MTAAGAMLSQTAALRAAQGPQGGSMAAAEAPMSAAEQRQHLMAEAEKAVRDRETRKAAVRRFLYRDVESLINQGFLSHPVKIDGVWVSLRSLSPSDLFLLEQRAPKGVTWRTWFVASAIWMVGGVNLLPYGGTAPWAYEWVSRMPQAIEGVLYSIALGLLNRMEKALWRTEAYCYEDYSRVAWRLCGRQNPARQEVNGIAGADLLGMNHIQRMWVAFNVAEDDRIQNIQGWQGAKLIASALSPKGIKKLNQSDENLRKAEERRRLEAIERMVYETIYGVGATEDTGEMVVVVRGQPVVVPRVKQSHSADDLAEEMRRWVAGEKDWHDIVVDTYKERIRQQFEDEKRKREAALERAQQQDDEEPMVTGLVGYTLDQIRDFRPDLGQPQSGGKRVFDGSIPSSLYQKYVAQEASPGRLSADGRSIHEGGNATEEESLQDQITSRNPAFSTMGPGKKNQEK